MVSPLPLQYSKRLAKARENVLPVNDLVALAETGEIYGLALMGWRYRDSKLKKWN
jgi:hypothetical protein